MRKWMESGKNSATAAKFVTKDINKTKRTIFGQTNVIWNVFRE